MHSPVRDRPSPAGRVQRRLVAMVLGALLCLFGSPAFAQLASLQGYGPNEGLPKLAADCLVADADGVVWVCTYVGLYRYDGGHFTRIDQSAGLQDTYITQLAPVSRGPGLWVATTGNLYFWDGERAIRILHRDGSAIPFSVYHAVTAQEGGAVAISGGRALRVVQGPGGWVASPLFDTPQLQAEPALGNLVSVYGDVRSLWFGCGKAICLRDAQGRISRFGSGEGVPPDNWVAFLRDSRGTLWARSPGRVIVLPAGANRFENRLPPRVILANTTSHLDLVEDRQGRVLTRGDAGLLRWSGSRWDTLDTHNGLPDQSPNALLARRGGDLWMSFSGLGVVRWRGYGSIDNWGAASGLRGVPTWSMVRDVRGAMLFGNDRNLYRLDHGISRDPLFGSASVRDIYSLARDAGGNVWLSLYQGQVLRVDGAGRAARVAASPDHLQRMLIDRRGVLWICGRRGMWSIEDPGNPVMRRVTALPAVAFGDVEEDAGGRLWFADKGGLFRRDLDGRFHVMHVSGDVPNQLFDKIAVGPDGQAWVGMDDVGLLHGQVGPGDAIELKRVDDSLLRQSLPMFIRYDHRGRLWVGGSAGVDVLQGGRWLRLNENSGLLSEDISESAFLEDDDGTVWIGNALGASHILHPDDLFSQDKVALEITRVERGGERVPMDAVLPWARLPVRLMLSTPGSTAGPDMLRFRYRLREQQDGWIETGSRTLDFPELDSGDQVIEVQALDLARRAQSPVVVFRFRMQPPWWRGTPALLAWLALAAALAGSLWKLRLRQVRAREYELAALVVERTQELEADKAALERTRAALQVQASHDGLTGLLNRASIMELLDDACRRAQRDGQALAIALFDLDHFKQVNDTHGHLAGDAVLRAVAERLRDSMRGSDAVGRYGGEEMLAVLPGMPSPATARLEELRTCISARPVETDGALLTITSSIGVAWLRPGESPTELLLRADAALYAAKKSGRDRIEIAPVQSAGGGVK